MKESKFKFRNPQMKTFIFKINENFDPKSFEGFPIQSKNDIKRDEDSTSALVTLTLTIGEKESNCPFYSEIVMSSFFFWDNETDNIDLLLKENAPALLLSYIRPIVSNAVANARLRAFDLPFMNFKESKKDS